MLAEQRWGQVFSTTDGRAANADRYISSEVTNLHPQPNGNGSLELPVDELLSRAKALPPHNEMVIDDLPQDEGAAFLATLKA